MSVHIGSVIKNYCHEHRITVLWLSKAIGMDTSSIYKALNRSNLDTDTILKFSDVLKHNFFQYFVEDKKAVSDTDILQLKQEISQLKQENEDLKRKNEILIRENELLSKFFDKMKPV
jgi:hypothetical protein